MQTSHLFMYSVLTCYRKTQMQLDTLQLKIWKKWLVENHCLKMFPGKGGREKASPSLWNEHSSVCKRQSICICYLIFCGKKYCIYLISNVVSFWITYNQILAHALFPRVIVLYGECKILKKKKQKKTFFITIVTSRAWEKCRDSNVP